MAAERRRKVAERTREYRLRLPDEVRESRRAADRDRARARRLRASASLGWLEAERAGLLLILLGGGGVSECRGGFITCVPGRKADQWVGTREAAEADLLAEARRLAEGRGA